MSQWDDTTVDEPDYLTYRALPRSNALFERCHCPVGTVPETASARRPHCSRFLVESPAIEIATSGRRRVESLLLQAGAQRAAAETVTPTLTKKEHPAPRSARLMRV